MFPYAKYVTKNPESQEKKYCLPFTVSIQEV